MIDLYRYTKFYRYHSDWGTRAGSDALWLIERFGPSGNSSGDNTARWSYIDNANTDASIHRTFYFPDPADYAEFVLVRGDL